ncbi:MAG TPA: DegT/DnrJ/EryC1/StrS family aminotransferase, partial [Candidatus Xenobia bacterium]
MVVHNRVRAHPEDAEAVARVVRSGQWAQGPQVAELERRLALMAGVRHAVCVGSGVAALRLSLLGLGVGPGDEVVMPGYCCVALPNAVLSVGAVPRRVDVGRGSWNLEGAVAGQAAIVVDTFGRPARVDFGVPVIEDCSHA